MTFRYIEASSVPNNRAQKGKVPGFERLSLPKRIANFDIFDGNTFWCCHPALHILGATTYPTPISSTPFDFNQS
jgi:hypothetical protein